MVKKINIACIGSRETTEEQRILFGKIGAFIVSNGWKVITGNAKGSDQAFAEGGNQINPKLVTLCLPWASYEKQAIVLGNKIVKDPYKDWFEPAALYHPNWANLPNSVRCLMARNYGIVSNSHKVIALLNNKKLGGGGTGHGWRVAEGLGIPRLDLNNKSFEEVIGFLEV